MPSSSSLFICPHTLALCLAARRFHAAASRGIQNETACLWRAVSAEVVEVDQAARLAIFAIVARLQPVASWIALHDTPEASKREIPALRSVSSGRPL